VKKKRKTMDLSTFAFCALIILSMLFVVSNYLASGLLAKYLSENSSSSDDARVAKWEINFDDSNIMNPTIMPQYLEYGSKGEWVLDIENSSEVAAILSSSSEMIIKLYSNKFDPEHNHNSWDFLEDNEHNPINNPLNYQIYLYNCSVSTLQTYYLNDGVFDNSIQQDGLNVQEYKLLDTQTTLLNFQYKIEDGMICYEAVVNVGELPETYILPYENGQACIRVLWNVDNLSGVETIDETFAAYHIVQTTEFNSDKYDGIVNKSTSEKFKIKDQSLTNDQINTYLTNNAFTIDGKQYVIVYQEKDAFDYLIYTSSLGGEVMITLEDIEGTYIKKSSKLSNDELTIVQSRTINSITTMTDLSKYIEKLNYNVFMDYMEEREQFESDSGYLGLGLKCKVLLNLKVEQVD